LYFPSRVLNWLPLTTTATLSTPGARAASIDIKDFYLNNPLPEPEYIRFLRESIPEDIWQEYQLDKYVDEH
jgi:hypothetical protein